MSYQKFSLDAFRTKLKTGGYANLTGANRAIGKTHELTDAEKEVARTTAAKHFGGSATVAKASKKTVKKVVKKAAKQATKKSAKKATPRKAAEPKEPAAPAKKGKKAQKKAAKKVSKKAATKRATVEEVSLPKEPAAISNATPSKTRTVTTIAASDTVAITISQMGNVVATAGQALKSMEDAKHLFPKGTFDPSVNQAVAVLGRAVEVLDQAVLAPRLAQLTNNSKPLSSKQLDQSDEVISSAPPVEELTESAQAELRATSKDAFDSANRGNALFSPPVIAT